MREWVRRLCCDRNRERPTRLRKATARQAPNARAKIDDKIITFIGDGAANTARSWLFAAGKLDFELRIAAPKKYQPKRKLQERRAVTLFAQMRHRRQRGMPTSSIRISGCPWERKPRQRGAKPSWVHIGSTTPGDALSAGSSRTGDRREELRSARPDNFRPGKKSAPRAESDSGRAGDEFVAGLVAPG